mmetsp:Transcript_57787/g.152010  ORF Transcript_57787/g.152010 Transcript_57787/m.152010 type:complete len:362 (-) Transcript_57787:110-1195(-)
MTKVFVGSLPPSITNETFQQLFSSYGQFSTIVCNPEKRYGFIVYTSMEEAQLAIASMNGFQMDGTTLVAKLAANQGGPGEGGGAAGGKGCGGGKGGGYGPAAGGAAAAGAGSAGERLYIKGLPPGCTDEMVRELFNNYGTVVDSKVLVANGKTDDGTGQSVAIVRFGSPVEAQWLVENLNGNIPQGLPRPVEVSYAGSKSEKGGEKGGAGYSPYGGKGAATAASPLWSPQPPTGGKGWDAGAAAFGGKGFGKGDMEVCVPSAVALKANASPGSTMYVKGLPVTADDLYVYRVFSPFGRVLSAKALPKDTFCIAFITMGSDLEAQEAVMQVNGQMLNDGNTLQVSIKNQKPGAGGGAQLWQA